MSILDHIVVLFFALGVPYLSNKSYPLVKAELLKQGSNFREQLYKSASIQQWVILTIVLSLCAYNGVDWQRLGFNPVIDTPATWLGFGVMAGYAGFSLFVLHQAQRHAYWDARLRRWLHNAPGVEVGPTNQREMQWFMWVSLTAGICEESIYRGYLMWYFSAYSTEWIALLITSVLFGLNHIYQGMRGILRTGMVGLVLGYVYLLTDSLFVPMLMHAMIDYYSGKMILYVNQTSRTQ